MRDVLLRSNFYNCQHVSYLEMGVFGTGAIWIDEDPKNGIRCEVFTAGEYYVANGADGKCNARSIASSAYRCTDGRAVWQREPQSPGPGRAQRGAPDQWFDCVQMVEPNADYLPGSKVSRLLPYVSLVWEKSAEPRKVLEHRGFHEFPVAVVRWDTLPGDCYGTGPGRRCLGDIKALQLYERSSAGWLRRVPILPSSAGITARKTEFHQPGNDHIRRSGRGAELDHADLRAQPSVARCDRRQDCTP